MVLSYNAKAEKKFRNHVHLGVLMGYLMFSLTVSLFVINKLGVFFDPAAVRIGFAAVNILLAGLLFFKVLKKKQIYLIQFVYTLHSFYLLFLLYTNDYHPLYLFELVLTTAIASMLVRKQEHLRSFLIFLVVSFLIVGVLYRPFEWMFFAGNSLPFLFGALSIWLFFDYKILSEKKFHFKDNVFATIFNHTNDTLLVVTPGSFEIVSSNNQGLTLLGERTQLNSVLGKKLDELLSPQGTYPNWQTLIDYLHTRETPWVETEMLNHVHLGSVWVRIAITTLEIDTRFYYLINLIDVSELVNKEIQLAQSRERLLQIINLLPHQIYLKDSSGKFLLTNEAVQHLLSDKEPLEVLESTDKEIIQSGKSSVLPEEYKYDSKGNLQSILHTTKIPFFLPEKNETGLLGVHIDITEQKLAEKNIRESEAKYKMLMEQASDGIYLADAEGNIVDANTKACEMFGYSKEEFLHKNIKDLTNSEYGKATSARVTDKYRQNILLERSFIKKDGLPLTVEISARLLENGGHQAILRDITERKKLENVLKESERKFRALIENASDMILILNQAQVIQYVSPSASKILHYSEQQMLGLDTIHLIHEKDRPKYRDFLNTLLQSPDTKHFLQDLRIQKSNREYRYIEVVGVNLLKDNVINGIIINIHDVTERKNTEIQLLNTNFELDSFVYRASHDMKAPLRSIMGLINITKKEAQNTPNLTEYFNMMEVSVVKLDNFLKNLTNFVRDSRLEISPEEINFEEVINESLNSLKFIENAHIIAIVKKIDVKSKFFSDFNRISTIINNLLSNSFKYHRNIPNESYIRIEIQADKEKASIVIEDNGSGVDKKYQSKIFDMFYRASEKSYGSGLGLYIVKTAITKLNGTIDLVSEPGEKTIFTIVLPNLYKQN
jgi:PAS domain S-box-containing protein